MDLNETIGLNIEFDNDSLNKIEHKQLPECSIELGIPRH